MISIVRQRERDLKPFPIEGATVQVSDPVVSADKNLSAGFTEYTEPSRLEWTFEYNEVFYMLKGALEIHTKERDPVRFHAGDLGHIEKGTSAVVVVPEYAYFVHFTQPAWCEDTAG
jgi:ethanolamine utilization protein EutQ (cupin superfamily)